MLDVSSIKGVYGDAYLYYGGSALAALKFKQKYTANQNICDLP